MSDEVDIAEKIKFTGTGESCDAVTYFLGGPNASHTHEWKTRTNDGGWVIRSDGVRDEFHPGDYIVRLTDGSFTVGHVCYRGVFNP